MKGDRIHFKDGDIIFQENDIGTDIYVLEEGQIDLMKQAGRTSLQLASLVQQGDLFGEMAAFDRDGRRSATARAHGAVEASVISKEKFFSQLENDPALAFDVMSKLVQRLRATDDMLAAQAAGNEKAAGNRAKRGNLPAAPMEGGARPEDDAAPKPQKPGLFARLFGTSSHEKPVSKPKPSAPESYKPSAEDKDRSSSLPTISGPPSEELVRAFQERHALLAALVADFTNDADGKVKEVILGSLSGHDGFLPIPMLESVKPSTETYPEPRLIESGQHAAKLITRASRGNVLLWGQRSKDGRDFELHFFPTTVEGELRPGGITQFFSLIAPVDLSAEAGNLIAAAAIAASVPRGDAHVHVMASLVPPTLSEARSRGFIPSNLSAEKTSGMLTAYGDVLAAIGFFETGPERYEEALLAYQAALDVTPRRDDSFRWAMLKRQMSTVHLALSERKRGGNYIDQAIQDIQEAMEVLTPDAAPWNRAAAQDRLGVAYYKMGAPDCNAPILQRALDSYQAALKVFTEKTSPQRWAEVQHNLGLLLQLLGAQFHRQDILKWAVESCRSALKVRKREEVPLLWANTQNTLGAALFLNYKEIEDDLMFVEAQTALQSAKDLYEAFGLFNKAKVAEVNLIRLESYVESHAPSKEDNNDWFLEEEETVEKV